MHEIQVKSILSARNGMNLYRGCTHGCIYCDSRSECYQIAHPFEDIAVKANALTLLEDALRRKRRKCMIATGSMSDPYQPQEETLGYTRQALELIARYGFGATVLTKSSRVLRDLDLLQRINQRARCVVQMTLTTYDEALCRKLEPCVSTTQERFQALLRLREAGIPTVVRLCPLLPFINDTAENVSGILNLCARAGVYGVICFGMGVTLRAGSREYFYAQLDRLFPGMKARYIQAYGDRYTLDSPDSAALTRLFHEKCAAAGMAHDNGKIFEFLEKWEDKQKQLSLFDF